MRSVTPALLRLTPSPSRFLNEAIAFSLAVTLVSCFVQGALGNDNVPDGRYFTARVLPILEQHCFECHSHAADESSGGLVLDSLAAMKVGGSRGSVLPVAAAGSKSKVGEPLIASNSLLIRAVEYEDTDVQMPPDGKLSESQIEVLRRWIKGGANVPETFVGTVAAKPERIADQAKEHWAYQSIPSHSALLSQLYRQSENADSHPVDRAVQIAQTKRSVRASPPADLRTLTNRLYFDLTGLPPDGQQFALADEIDQSQVPAERDAYLDNLIDRLLASSSFGERFARHWMDVARYADNKGYVFREDREYAEAYRYRDWLIAAFNQDMPLDRFIKLQIAADLIPSASESDLPALGFLTLGRRFLNNKHDIIDDRIDVVSRGLMGMTIACARCHDHKYDPISQADYYALYGVFDNSSEPGGAPWPHRLAENEKLRDAFVFVRGVAGRRGDKVPRRFVSFLSEGTDDVFKNGSGRQELAERLASADNPLTARVMANRIWMHLMGRPLVETPSDFGLRSERPEMDVLLDLLASKLIDADWSLKELVRYIVNSRTYQQSSVFDEQFATADPENRTYWRSNRRRRDFESLRDSLLAVSGQLDSDVGGQSEKIETRDFSHRRTLYAYIDRQNLPGVFRTFDLASPDAHSPRRSQTSVPQQGLYLLNSDFMASIAQTIAVEIDGSVGSHDTRGKILTAFQRILGRQPDMHEVIQAEALLATATTAGPTANLASWEYGYTKVDDSGAITGPFNPLPHFTGDAWQGGTKLPDPKIGWCMLSADGGHPGNDLSHAVVRRWRASKDGSVSISG
ncbi:MAG TPA: cytochrome C, partial [Planctomycetaceae bacterium]|nr:cytochrome C [Planctomycetaceae bacterium]